MNDRVRFDLEWESVAGSRGQEIRATWARFSLVVDGKPVTRVLDPRSRSYRDHILIPMYPIAEWLVTRWWPLLFEPESPERTGYKQRHYLRFGREGYLFPDLRLFPIGEALCITWEPFEVQEGMAFVAQGSARVERVLVEECLTEYVETVVARLESQGISGTLLQEEWEAIQGAGSEERAFCIAASQLGQDPYSLSDALAEAVVQAGEVLPAQWRDEFFSVVRVEQLSAHVEYALQARQAIEQHMVGLGGLHELRRQAHKVDLKTTPWKQGYEAAQQLRAVLGVGTRPLANDAALADVLGVGSLPIVDVGVRPQERWLDAMVLAEEEGRGGFATMARRPENRRFAFCRALFEYLSDADAPSALVTAGRTERQKRNRAFAAELLAPSRWLQDWCAGEYVGPDELADAAATLGVSTEVVHRQLQNHGIAHFLS